MKAPSRPSIDGMLQKRSPRLSGVSPSTQEDRSGHDRDGTMKFARQRFRALFPFARFPPILCDTCFRNPPRILQSALPWNMWLRSAGTQACWVWSPFKGVILALGTPFAIAGTVSLCSWRGGLSAYMLTFVRRPLRSASTH